MFNNVGYKIKMTANIICMIGIIVSGISFVILLTQRLIPIALITLITGSLGSWLSNLCLYGFGELVENSDIRTNILAKYDLEHDQNKTSTFLPFSAAHEEKEGNHPGPSSVVSDSYETEVTRPGPSSPVSVYRETEVTRPGPGSVVSVSRETNSPQEYRRPDNGSVSPVSETRKRRR